MRKFLFFLSLLIFSHLALIAQLEWVNPSPSGNRLNGIFFIDSEYGWAVGSGGTILKTTDGGVEWKDISSWYSSDLYKVQFLNRKVGWIVGGETYNGVVLKTTDGGETWVDLNPVTPYSNGFTKLKFFSENFGYISGFNGVYKTTNGGDTWLDKGGPNWTTVLCFIDSSTGFIANTLGSIYKTTNGADTWNEVLPKEKTWFRDIKFLDDRTGWFIADGLYDEYTIIYKTTDGGDTWSPVDSMDGLVHYEMEIINKDTILICGQKGVLRSTDGGENWANESPNGGDDYFDMTYNNNKLWIVGGDYHESIIQYSDNLGWPWKKVNSNYTFNFIKSIDFFDENIGWFVGLNGALFKTTDGGQQWVEQKLFSIDLSSVASPSESYVYVAGSDGEFLYSSNFGQTWATKKLGDFDQNPVLQFTSPSNGYYFSSNWGQFLKTTDFGQSWYQLEITPSVYDLEMINDSIGFALSIPLEAGYSILTITKDAFNTSSEYYFNEYITAISFLNESIGYASSYTSIYKTLDGGNNWETIVNYNDIQFTPIDIVFVNENDGGAIGEKNNYRKFLITQDGGYTFRDIRYLPTAEKLFKKTNEIWITGEYGALIKYDFLLTDIKNENNKEVQSLSFGLRQNYPNPFNSMTKIEYSLKKQAKVNISIYNVLGQKVDEIVDEFQFPGTYSINYDAANLSSGVYIYTLTTEYYRQSQKFVLIK